MTRNTTSWNFKWCTKGTRTSQDEASARQIVAVETRNSKSEKRLDFDIVHFISDWPFPFTARAVASEYH